MPITLTLLGPGGGQIPCRVEGAVYQPRAGVEPAVLLLRLTPKRETPSQFAVLTRQVQDLNREVARRQKTEQELREQREWFRVTLSSIGDGVIATDQQGQILFLNPVAEMLTGWSREEALGRQMGEVFHIVSEETREPVANPVRRVLAEGIVVGLANHTILISRQGREWPIADSAAPIRSAEGRIVGVVLVFLEITERKRIEDQLRRQTQDLLEADRRKDEYLAMLAHELRNPLGAVSNALNVLERTQPGSSAYLRAQDVARRQIQQQVRVVDDLLDVSRITRGTFLLQPERIELGELCRQTADDFRPAFDQAGIRLSLERPGHEVWVDGDPVRLTQTLVNLLNNAQKFTPPERQVHVGLEVDGPGERAVLSVSDTGAGIAAELLPHVFEAFRQGEQTLARSSGGLGLGLALVKGIVELHGGTVSAHSPGPGQGATFTVVLPLASQPTVVKPVTALHGDTVGLSILIIEDNADAGETLRDLLKLWGHRVDLALSGASGLEVAGTLRPDVVLCDIGLPDIDGFELGRRLRRNPATAHCHLVAVTGYGQAQDRARTAEAGFDHHLVKPVDL
ncbi:MAG: tmoS, partial [Armatimonadetes bacterium]|nr:tmoS [Armatimonadota bacterium]